MLRVVQKCIQQFAFIKKAPLFKLLDQVQNKFKTITMANQLKYPREVKISPRQLSEQYGGCEIFFTEKFIQKAGWNAESLNLFQEGNLKIVQAQYGQSVDSRAESDLLHSYIPEYNVARDLSQLIFNKHFKELTHRGSIFFGLEQNIVRGLRFASQITTDKVDRLVISGQKPNLKHLTNWLMDINNLEEWKDIIRIEQTDVFNHLIHSKDTYDVVDIEVKGSGLDFVAAILPSLRDDGIISLNFTEFTENTIGAQTKISYTYCTEHPSDLNNDEIILRKIYYAIDEICESQNLTPQPIFHLALGAYVKIYFKVKPRDHKQNKFSLICGGCQNTLNATKQFTFQNSCQYCQSPLTISGPLWNGDLVDKDFVQVLLESEMKIVNQKTIMSMLTNHLSFARIQDLDQLKEINFSQLSRKMGLVSTPNSVIMGTFRDHNYKMYQSPFGAKIFHTDAPYEFIFHFINQWIKKQAQETLIIEESMIRENLLISQTSNETIEFTKQQVQQSLTYLKLNTSRKGYSRLPRSLYMKSQAK